MFSVLILALGLGLAQACCPPEQWETTAFDMNSLDSYPYYVKIAHDDHTRMEGVFVYVIGMGGIYKHYVKDYNTMTQYEIEMSTTPTCRQTRLQETFVSKSGCESGPIAGMTNMQSYGYVRVGLPPSTVDMERLSFDMDGRKFWVGMAQNGCFPVYQKVKSADSAMNIMLFHFNATDRVVTPNIFTIPAACHDAV